ncbi:hypothetical protein E2C01_039201 [Portunus trituberculatus]|uniref:Uncharacterized protein n=1 Tax=Portunus trituberculatus TaxID=210409 RepID=A0A5B7FG87_PORTR|nr:hypothetical protein [Portunus trituberculatus]
MLGTKLTSPAFICITMALTVCSQPRLVTRPSAISSSSSLHELEHHIYITNPGATM